MNQVKTPKKLIEVALPLDDINAAAAREKSIRHGHPSTLHLWWARRPLAAARAVIFAQMVNDPGYERHLGRGINKEKAQIERERLFDIIGRLVRWENTNNEEVFREAQEVIWKSWRETCALNRNHPKAAELFNPDKLPAFYDPFAGGGAIPLEAQRLGLESYASDLNPVAVTINKAMIEFPPKFAGRPPIGPDLPGEKQLKLHKEWTGTNGLAEDVRRYGTWIRYEAEKRIGHLYPKVEITADLVTERPDLKPYLGQKLTVVAWLWARTVKSPNPAFSETHVPLVSSFVLSPMAGKEAYVEPEIYGDSYRFTVKVGTPPDSLKNGTKLARGANFRCILSNSPIEQKHIRDEFKAKRSGERLMAVVAEGERGRVYLAPPDEHEAIARQAQPNWKPEVEMNQDSKDLLSGRGYGFKSWHELFTQRQLVALTTFTDLVGEAIGNVRVATAKAGWPDDGISLDDGGTGATAYAEAIGVYLAFLVSKLADKGSTICTWDAGPTSNRTASGRSARVATVRVTFGRQALPMTWDFAEVNFFSESVGSTETVLKTLTAPLTYLPRAAKLGHVSQCDAQNQSVSTGKVVSTDPPYYDNIGYADLSDFFYVWLRKNLRQLFPRLYATVAVPKAEELVAQAYRHGGKDKAESFFLEGMSRAIHNLAENAHPAFPVTIYYAFKQSETKGDAGTTSTGWETFLEAVLRAGFAITGTWPMRTELSNRMIGSGTNALASSIVLVCRKRSADAQPVSRREFLRELNAVLPDALDEMTRGGINSPVAPVDLSQAIIGPGMAIFSRYPAVLEADGSRMTVRTALQLINRFLAEDDFDHDTQFCLHWFENQGWAEGKYGEADVLARAKGTSVSGVSEAGVLESGKGVVRLLRYGEYANDWSPEKDNRTPVWEALHHLIRALQHEGEAVAGSLLARMPERAEPIRQLAYRLYTLCERKGWAEDARAYNELITSWQAIETASQEAGHAGEQMKLDY
jgi:putative DNA methylase